MMAVPGWFLPGKQAERCNLVANTIFAIDLQLV
jgi:hypothetical protein